jgi:hypothetical protein
MTAVRAHAPVRGIIATLQVGDKIVSAGNGGGSMLELGDRLLADPVPPESCSFEADFQMSRLAVLELAVFASKGGFNGIGMPGDCARARTAWAHGLPAASGQAFGR